MPEYLNFISVDFWHIVMSMGNLVILTFIMKKFLFEPVNSILKQREDELKSVYTKAESALSEAENNRELYGRKIEQVRAESDNIIKSAVLKAKNEEESIVKEANEKALEVLRKADFDVEIKKKKAVISMKDDISDIIIKTAQKVIGREVTAEAHNDLINVAIDELCER